MQTLKIGTTLYCIESRQPCIVRELLGEGGQGEVYLVTVGNEERALKWYNDLVLRVDQSLQRRLQLAIDMGAPSPHFLWPQELVTDPQHRRLGYVMRLRRKGTVKMQALLAQEVRPSFRTIAFAGWQLTDALFALHGLGLAYRDMNAGNIFVDPRRGQVEVCDNDNVDIDGAPSVIGGVMEYQSPEVVLRHAGPSRASDLHSLAVMLFRMLHIGHPLVGAREAEFANLADPKVMRRLYGSEARFVFDPIDASNRPTPEAHGPVLGHWAIYPQTLRDLFTRAFTVGLYDPASRVQESEWRRALRMLHDAILTCPACGAQNFHDPQRKSAAACWGCGRPLPGAPLRLGLRRRNAGRGEVPDHVIVIEPGACIFADQFGLAKMNPQAVVAEVMPSPGQSAPRLRNFSDVSWTVQDIAGSRSIHSGEEVLVVPGLRLAVGDIVGTVRS
jgi:DNA-binding helix-hairpin-helix protein with protein kinase domain